MSSHAYSPDSTGALDRLAPQDAFDLTVWQNPEVCNHCFSQIRREDTHQMHDTDKLATEGNVLKTRQRAGAGVLGYDYTALDPYAVTRVYQPRTYCNECGANDGRANDVWVMSAHDAQLAAGRLVEQLERQGVACDGRALRTFVRRCKSDDQGRIDGRETEMFRRATEVAVRRARR